MNKNKNHRFLKFYALFTFIIFSTLLVPIAGFEIVFADEVIETIRVGLSPSGVAYNERNGYMYVTNSVSGTVSIIDGSTVIDTITVARALGIAYNEGNGYMYVTDGRFSGTVSIIDGDTVIDTVPVGFGFNIAYNEGNGYMYVTNAIRGTVSIIDGDTVVGTVPVGLDSYGVAYNPSNGYMYVTNPSLRTVSVIDGSTVVGTINVGNGPGGVAFNPDNGYMYVTIINSDSVSIIDGTTVIDTVAVGNAPVAVAYNERNGNMYVVNQGLNSNSGSYTVSIIDGTTVIDTVAVGNGPGGVAFNPDNGYMYVTNSNSNSVSVISTGTTPEVLPPTATTITSSVDGNENQVQNQSSTVSTSITLEVSATPGTNPISGFECSLDDSPFSNCSTSNPSTIQYDDLAADREHVFKVRAIDNQGNTDVKPSVFIWTVLTPEQGIDKLIETIEEMGLSKGTTTSLQAPLNAAAKHLDNNKEAQACGPLGAFLDQVNDKEGNGQLTSQQASDLRQQATAIQKKIGCISSTFTSTTLSSSTSESSSLIESLFESTLSNIDPTQSKQASKELDKIQEGMGLYSDFFGIK